MEELEGLPEEIRNHIFKNMPLSSLDGIEKAWKDRYKLYLKLVTKEKMVFVDNVHIEHKDEIYLFTYSGSILMLGSEVRKRRKLQYYCLEDRRDTPESLTDDSIKILNDIYKGRSVYFDATLIKNSSPIYKIAINS